LFECLDQQVVNIGTLVEGDLLAFEIGNALERAVFGNQNRLALWRRRLMCDIDERRARGLGKYRRRLADRTKINGADIEPLEKLGTGGKLRPLDFVTKWLQRLFDETFSLQQNERSVFLEADPDHAGFGAGLQRDLVRNGREGGGRQAELYDPAPRDLQGLFV